ncbi:MAG: precorrin-3B C(17)-methyltransferase, partial [Desulfovibrio sp.]|nr:precorrin-3B C(17)-methyltransferase [Desulfovibrio sp.]
MPSLHASPSNELFVIGLGPGDSAFLPPMAHQAFNRVSCIAGYPLYLDLIPAELKKDKICLASGMRHEEERCQKAIETALSGKATALVSSGDPGIYALAGLVLELMEAQNLFDRLSLSIIPGIPALAACAALLGAPLSHDFACISLSDLLTPWETIYKRLKAALEADFVLVLYNPRSQGRPHYLQEALNLAKEYRSELCPVGCVRNAFRDGQSVMMLPLQTFDVEKVDMLSLVIIGNTQTRAAG